MKLIKRLQVGLKWLYRICHLFISGLLLISVIVLSGYMATTSFPLVISKSYLLAIFTDQAILLLIAGFFALAFIPSFICWVQKPLSYYLRNRGVQNPNPAPEITTPKLVKAVNVFFALVLILAGFEVISFYREKMARSNLTQAYAVADQARRAVEYYITLHNGQLPKTIAETEFTNQENRYVSSVVFNAENGSLTLVLKEFSDVKSGATLTFVKLDQGWDCFSKEIPQIHLMQRCKPATPEGAPISRPTSSE